MACVCDVLADTECWERDGIHPEGAVRRDRELLVHFRWKRNPHSYSFLAPLDNVAESPWTREPVRSAEAWAQDLGGLLEEELLTGYVASATRTLVDGRIELRAPIWPWHHGYNVQPVDARMARALANAGLDIEVPVRLRTEGGLLGWAAMFSSDAVRWVGTAATCWYDATTARLVHLSTVPGLPATATIDLVRAAICEAADSGAGVVVSDTPVPHGEVLGFTPAGPPSVRLNTDLLAQDFDALTILRRALQRK